MDCPYCKNEMQAKFLSSSRNVYLKDEEVKGAMLPIWTRGAIGTNIGATNIPVNYCEHFQKIEIDLKAKSTE